MVMFLMVFLLLSTITVLGQSTKTKVMKVSNNQQPTHPVNIALESFKKEVEERTNGSITVKIFPSAILGDDNTNMDQVRLGVIESAITMGAIGNLVMGSNDPLSMFEELPFLFPDAASARKAWDGPIGERYIALGAKHGLKVLCFWENGFRNMTNNVRPIVGPEDMKGIKFRIAPSEIRQVLFKTLNATAIPMAFAELFTGLQQGTVQGQENPLSIIQTSKFYEVQKYLSLSRHIYNTATFYVNPAWFNSLTKDEQKIIQEASEHARDYMRKLNDDFEANALSFLESKGMKINKVDSAAFAKASEPVWKYFIAKFPGSQELIDLARGVK